MKCLPCLHILPLLAFGASCAPSLDLPPPPEVDEAIQSLDDPSATVVADTMARVAEEIETAYESIDESDVYLELLEVIFEVQEELEKDPGDPDDEGLDENGDLVLGGVTFPSPNGAVGIDFICGGWDPDATAPDLANGTLDLTMTLVGGAIGPLVWGEAEGCKFLSELASQVVEASYDGGVAVYFGDVFSASEDLLAVPITFIVAGTILLEGVDIPIEQVFRVQLSGTSLEDASLGRLEILVVLDDDKDFVYFFEADGTQGIIDATGTLSCSLEESRCTGSSGSFSW